MELKDRVGDVAQSVLRVCLASGLTWDESVAALGVASKMLATEASAQGDGNVQSCVDHAAKRFLEGLAQEVVVAHTSRPPSSVQ